MIELLVYVAIIGLIVWVIVNLVPMPQPIKTVVVAVACLIILLVVLRALGGGNVALGQTVGPGCLGTFAGEAYVFPQTAGYRVNKVRTWVSQARFDARGSVWWSHMNGDFFANHENRKRVAPIQLGFDLGDNIDGSRRRDPYKSEYNTAPGPALCWHGGLVIGTQPLNATWRETKIGGGGYAIFLNAENSVVEAMRVHNHHDGFNPYRSNGFVYRGNWQSYSRDDCIENDASAGGRIVGNLFDGCYVFYSDSGGGISAGGRRNTVEIAGNLIRMEAMPGPAFENPRTTKRHGTVLKIQPDETNLPRLIFRDNVLALDGAGPKGAFRALTYRIDECSSNTLLWLGNGALPYAEDFAKVRKCFTLITGAAAREQWQQRRAAWIAAHPEIARID